MLRAALAAMVRLDGEHATGYFRIVYNALREPMQRALEALVMQWQAESKENLPPFIQGFVDRGRLEAKRETLLDLAARAGIALGEADRNRIAACTDAATLDRWLGNVLVAKTARDLLT